MEDHPDDPKGTIDETRFPLTGEDQPGVEAIIALVRRRLRYLRPRELRSAATILLALERLPAVTDGVVVTFGFSYRDGGNLSWANIGFADGEFRLDSGEHFYEPTVGGDTESTCLFEAYAGGGRSGNIRDWLEVAEGLHTAIGEDLSAHDDLDWSEAEEPMGWDPKSNT
jgi:hypothetical protein